MPNREPYNSAQNGFVFTRRAALKCSAVATILATTSSCQRLVEFFEPKAPDATIDIHAHIFNGRDLPVNGFFTQVVLREPHAPTDPSFLTTSFTRLVTSIMLSGTPSARTELTSLRKNGVVPQTFPEIIEQDEARVAAALGNFAENAEKSAPAGLAGPTGDQRIFDRLANEVGQPGLRNSLQAPRAQARTLARGLYATNSENLDGRVRRYRHASPFVQTLRWAGLLTRGRADVLAEIVRLYGGESGVRVFAPSIVDFEKWLTLEDPGTSPIRDQIEVYAALALGFTDSLILNFVPFCPLRAALEREDARDANYDALANVKFAVEERGFAGVKLYPPMGFQPIGNASLPADGAPRMPVAGPVVLDDELNALYRWCLENDVPIKAHANKSVSAQPGSDAYASPLGWRTVLEQEGLSGLRINLAHFGGFEETANGSNKAEIDWEVLFEDMIDNYDNVYCDLGFWTEVADNEAKDRDRIIELFSQILKRSPRLKRRIMYGSDWSMIGRVPNHPTYRANVQTALKSEFDLTEPQVKDIMGANAARYLGLAGSTRQRSRLDQFFGDHPIYQEIMNT